VTGVREEAVLGRQNGSFPLSAAQLALWLVDHMVDRQVSAIEGCLLRVEGEVEPARLRGAVADVVARHPALRIGCEVGEQGPIQRVTSQVDCELAVLDLSTLSPNAAEARAALWAVELAKTPFDLRRPPLWRSGMARLPGGVSLIGIAAHHLICDGWTLGLLLAELSQVYRNAASGADRREPLAPYPECLLERDDDRRRNTSTADYWRPVLAACNPPRLGLAGPPAAGGPPLPRSVDNHTPLHLSRQVRTVARGHQVTPFTVFAAAYAVAIGRLTGQEDIPLGTIHHGRTTPCLKRVAGMFATTLVLPTDLSGDPSFGELLRRLGGTYRQVMANRQVTLEELTSGRNLLQRPIFRHALSYHPARFAVSEFAGMPTAMDLLSTGGAHHELELHVRELDDSFALQLRFDPSAMDLGSARAVLDTFTLVLSDLASSPQRSIALDGLASNVREGWPDPLPGAELLPIDPSAATTQDLPPFTPPRSPREEIVASIWARLLGVPEVSVLDNFFELGGHSLMASQAVARMREAIGVDIPLRVMFEGSGTVAQLCELIDGLPSSPPSRPPVPRQESDEQPSLSFDQQRLWVVDQLAGGTSAYNVHGRRLLRGAVDIPALERSIRAILTRHEALRTRFPSVDGRQTQVVEDCSQWRLDVVDFASLDGDPHVLATDLADHEAGLPFDLATGPVFRCRLLRIDEAEHLLVVTMHHIVADAWSVDLFRAELAELYRVGGDVSLAELPALPVQYRDFAVWQREWLSGELLTDQLEHWRSRLDGAPVELVLPTLRPRGAVRSFTGGRVCEVIAAANVSGLKAVCREAEATTFMAVLAAMAAVLRRWSGTKDVVIGVPISTRTAREVEPLIGLFVNMLAMRVDVTGNPTFAELLVRARETALDAYAHQDLPFDYLVEQLKPPRQPTSTPFFQVVLNVLSVGRSREQLPGVVIEAVEEPVTPSKFDLTMTVQDHGDRLGFELAFNAELFDVELMRAFLAQVCSMLRAAPGRRAKGVLDLPLSGGPAEATAALPGSSAAPYAMFEAAVRRNPEATAISEGGQVWSYRVVAQLADTLAGVLSCHAAAGTSAPIGICSLPSARLVVTVLACLRAGIPFAVVDPGAVDRWTRAAGNPRLLDPGHGWLAAWFDGRRNVERAVLEEVRAASVGSTPAWLGQGLESAFVTVVDSPADQPLLLPAGRDVLASYARWWSASTPTGCRSFALLSALDGQTPVEDLFAVLTLGASLHIPDEGVCLDPGLLVGWLAEHRISVVGLAAPLLRALGQAVGGVGLPDLRLAVTEPAGLQKGDVAAFRVAVPGCGCISRYTVAGVTRPLAVQECTADWPQEAARTPDRRRRAPAGQRRGWGGGGRRARRAAGCRVLAGRCGPQLRERTCGSVRGRSAGAGRLDLPDGHRGAQAGRRRMGRGPQPARGLAGRLGPRPRRARRIAALLAWRP
jgi:non-ribosomal peptide synthetase component F